MKIGQWRIGRGSYGQMRPKSTGLGQMGGFILGSRRGNHFQTGPPPPTVKHGGGNNLMVWGCMGWNGVGKLTEVQGIMDPQQYCDILDDGVVESFEKLEVPEEERIFQQDNDPKHTSKKATQWFEDNDIQVLVWTAQSPNINPIEYLWVHLKRAMLHYPTPPKGVHELWDRVVEEWNKIPPETCQKLIESMPRRIQTVIRARGAYKLLITYIFQNIRGSKNCPND